MTDAQDVIGLVEGGYLDDDLTEIQKAVTKRLESRRQEVLELVHEVYGPDATVVLQRQGSLR